jgi:hypothetical protein
MTTGALIDFDTLSFPFETYNDGGGATTLSCAYSKDQAHTGTQSLRLDFAIAANGWATCAHFYDNPQNWSGGQGLSFYLRSSSSGPIINVDVYAGPEDQRETYAYTLELPPESVNIWIPVELRWEDFHRLAWEENADAPFEKSGQVTGFAFGFPTYQDADNSGTIWIDDVSLFGTGSAVEPGTEPVIEPTMTSAVEPTPGLEQITSRGRLPCAASAILPIASVILAWMLRRNNTG